MGYAGVEKAGKQPSAPVGDGHHLYMALLEEGLYLFEELVFFEYHIIEFIAGVVSRTVVAHSCQLYLVPLVGLLGEVYECEGEVRLPEETYKGVDGD